MGAPIVHSALDVLRPLPRRATDDEGGRAADAAAGYEFDVSLAPSGEKQTELSAAARNPSLHTGLQGDLIECRTCTGNGGKLSN